MGLAERRATTDFQEKHFSAWEKKLHAALGTATPIEVDWAQLSKPDYAHLYQEAWEKVYFTPLLEAFKEIGKDDLGRKALQSGVKKIWIGFTDTSYSNIRFEDGVIFMDHDPVSNLDYHQARKDELVQLLEKNL